MNPRNRKRVFLIIFFLIITLPLILIGLKQNLDNRSSAAAADKLEAESGILGGYAITYSDSNASGGNYVQLGVSDKFMEMRNTWSEYLTGGDFETNDPNTEVALNNKVNSIRNNARSIQASMITDPNRTYLFPDIPGPNGGFGVDDTYDRLYKMALGYSTKGAITDPTEKEKIYASIKDGLIWLQKNWYNKDKCKNNIFTNGATECRGSLPYQVGSAQGVSSIIILLYDRILQDSDGQQIINDNMDTVERFYPNGGPANRFYPAGTGVHDTAGNLAMTTIALAQRAAIKKDQIALKEVLKNYNEDFLIYKTSGDGLYADGSFIQHNDHPYNMWYGLLYLKSVTDLSYLLLKSGVIDSTQGNLYAQWYKNAYQPFSFNNDSMDIVKGRIAAWPRESISTNSKPGLIPALTISQLASGQQYQDIAADIIRKSDGNIVKDSINTIIWSNKVIKNQEAQSSALIPYTTIKIFPSMDKAVFIKPNYAFALSMSSARTSNYETIDGVNKKGWYTNDGMVYFYNSSDPGQYNDFFWATVDKTKLPGTTIDQQIKLDSNNKYIGSNFDMKFADYLSPKLFTGGTVLNDKYLAAGMALRSGLPEPIFAKKSWFIFEDKLIAMGSEISGSSGTEAYTIVENRKINNNNISVDGSQVTSLTNFNNPKWAHINGTGGYYFPTLQGVNATISAMKQARTGNWAQLSTGESTTNQTRNFAEIWFNHGLNPKNGKYAYIFLPNSTETETIAYSQNPTIQILVNSTSVHAIKESSGLIGANFFSAGTAGLITSQNQSSVILKEINNTLDFSASDPTQNQDSLTFNLNKNAKSVISKDPKITILSLSPIKFSINTTDSMGKSFNIKFSL